MLTTITSHMLIVLDTFWYFPSYELHNKFAASLRFWFELGTGTARVVWGWAVVRIFRRSAGLRMIRHNSAAPGLGYSAGGMKWGWCGGDDPRALKAREGGTNSTVQLAHSSRVGNEDSSDLSPTVLHKRKISNQPPSYDAPAIPSLVTMVLTERGVTRRHGRWKFALRKTFQRAGFYLASLQVSAKFKSVRKSKGWIPYLTISMSRFYVKGLFFAADSAGWTRTS